jgi:class 3 adenylate cyclase
VPARDADELEALGVYDPSEPHAPQRLELLRYLRALGASDEDLCDFSDQLAGLPSVLAIRDGRGLTLHEVAERSGVAEERVMRVASAAGLPRAGSEDRAFTERFVDLVSGLGASEDVFGETALLALLRVMGSAMARLADASVSAFLVNVDPGLSERDPVGLEVARANAQAGQLLPGIARALDALLRQHLLLARRSSLGAAAEGGYERRHLCVGFVDLVGSTGLALDAGAAALGEVLTQFETAASETVMSAGGRVVKLIGDEVLFTAPGELTGCEIALALARRFAEHATVPPVRAGLASGDVLLRDGDVFGPVVNLAARVVAAARPGEVLAPADLVAAAGLPADTPAQRQLKGFDAPVTLRALLPSGSCR